MMTVHWRETQGCFRVMSLPEEFETMVILDTSYVTAWESLLLWLTYTLPMLAIGVNYAYGGPVSKTHHRSFLVLTKILLKFS